MAGAAWRAAFVNTCLCTLLSSVRTDDAIHGMVFSLIVGDSFPCLGAAMAVAVWRVALGSVSLCVLISSMRTGVTVNHTANSLIVGA